MAWRSLPPGRRSQNVCPPPPRSFLFLENVLSMASVMCVYKDWLLLATAGLLLHSPLFQWLILTEASPSDILVGERLASLYRQLREGLFPWRVPWTAGEWFWSEAQWQVPHPDILLSHGTLWVASLNLGVYAPSCHHSDNQRGLVKSFLWATCPDGCH